MDSIENENTAVCNECGCPALYWSKGWEEDNYFQPDSYWCEEHRHFEPASILINDVFIYKK